jgi:hypothetical protein
MRQVFCIVLAIALLFGGTLPAAAGCCPNGSTTYDDFSGIMPVQVGGATCYFLFQHCKVTIYNYVPCENGTSPVLGMRVSGFPDCNYTTVGYCAVGTYFRSHVVNGEAVDDYFMDC